MSEREYYKDPEYRKKQSKAKKKLFKDNLKYRDKTLMSLNKHRNTKRDPITGKFVKQNVQAKEK